MFLINLETHDPCFYLALEEVLLKHRREDYLILGINDPSVIIGKHQAAHREVNTRYVTENKIPVVRRISGGGTVFHDRGNLNFSFIKESEEGKQIDFRLYTRPVIDFLLSLGIEARFEGRNDIKVDGLKISGNAEHVHRNRVLHHGTLLFSTAMDMLRNSIRTDKSCYATRGVDSNPASVMNLNRMIKKFSDIHQFRNAMMHHFSDNMKDLVASVISHQDSEDALTLAETKYRRWEWNFAYGPDYVFRNEFRLDGKPHSCILNISNGVVMKCKMEGSDRMIAVAEKLKGCRHMVIDFLNVFEKENTGTSEGEIYNFF
jgi:lipoate-protein ligase A